MAVFGEDFLFERAGINADSNRNTALLAGVGHRLYPVVRADVARINPNFVNACGTSLKRELIVKVNIGDDGHADRFL